MVRGTTSVVGVFGWPVRHSASPAMHNAAFADLGLDWVYVPFAVAPKSVGQALEGVRALNIVGVNVTVPLKERVLPYLDSCSESARAIGSVNTIVHREGRLHGESTDGPGFLAALHHAGLPVRPQTRAVVLGAGGSARAVIRALLEAGAHVIVANRTPNRAADLVRAVTDGLPDPHIDLTALEEPALRNALENADLLVNTTSVGMAPHTEEVLPVPATLPGRLLVVDLIYNPIETRLLRQARESGCRTQNGIEMLVRQGAISFRHWTGREPSIDRMREAVEAVLAGS
ncbi:MAG: shikimate dehydrogenase [Capsulimonadales bacterium]|nr:shikimate dehydrogenase [Capsulimonadales bacterium]